MSKKHSKTYSIRQPVRLWYIIGVFCAVCLPVLWGCVNLWPFVQYIMRGCDGIRSGNCWGPNFFVRNKQLAIPIYLTFVFGTLFAAFIGTLKVRRQIEGFSRTLDFGIVGIKSASWAHLTAGVLHEAYLFMRYSPNPKIIEKGHEAGSETIMILLVAILIHLILWIFVTIPLGLICGSIFKFVAAVETDSTLK